MKQYGTIDRKKNLSKANVENSASDAKIVSFWETIKVFKLSIQLSFTAKMSNKAAYSGIKNSLRSEGLHLLINQSLE